MAIEVGNNSSYVIAAGVPADDSALSYSRHYVRKIHDLGKSSRQTWIQTLVDHVLHGPGSGRPQRGGAGSQDVRRSHAEGSSASYENSPKMSQRRKQDHSVGFDLAAATSRRDGRIMNSLQNSPYLPKTKIAQENPSAYLRKIVQSRDQGRITSRSRDNDDAKRQKENLDVSDTQSNSSHRSHHYPPIKSAPAFKENKVRFVPKELSQSPYVSNRSSYTIVPLEKILAKKPPRTTHGNQNLNRVRRSDPGSRTAHPYGVLPQHHNSSHRHSHQKPARAEAWKPGPSSTELTALEKRAKTTATRAIKENKVFTCEGPYPVDAYVRFSLRKRGWVEKFGPKIHSNLTNGKGTSSKLECEVDEDFDTICDHNIPAPWKEEHGLYVMMSRLVRHRPARFIWAGRAVNALVLHQDVIVNHFPKARTFSSKTGIASSLRDLPWLASSDPHDFFPRCYLLSEEERDDLIDDFRLTTCISLLKWVMQKFTTEETKEKIIQPERSKTIEIIHEEDEDKESIVKETETPNKTAKGEDGTKDEDEPANDKSDDKKVDLDEEEMDMTDIQNNNISPIDALSDTEVEKDDDIDEYANDPDFASATDSNSPSDSDDDQVDKASTPINVKGSKRVGITIQDEFKHEGKVKPKIVFLEKSGGEIPSKAVDWALGQCERYIQFKIHADIDQKNKPNLTAVQWDQLLRWFYKVAHDGATVTVTQSKVQRIKDTLAKIRKLCRQFDMDGTQNIWIIKPGGKSKGIGIEFCNNLDDMLKYVDNPPLSGTYVVQKYIETPLLLFKTKFDIRQWFTVTDWNPLTVWFYKGCYLRICSQEYSIDTMHEAVHLTNVAIQQFYLNGEREGNIPEDNYMHSQDFEEYLSSIGYPTVWQDKIYPMMKKAVINTLLATSDTADNKKCAFELYGADFMISDSFVPWLLEINSSPGMAPQTKEKAKLCANVIEDLMKVVLDRRENRNTDTGGFELAFKDTPLPTHKTMDSRMIVEGSRIKRTDLHRYASLDNVVKSGEDVSKNDLLKILKNPEKKKQWNQDFAIKSNTKSEVAQPPRDSVTRGGAKQDVTGKGPQSKGVNRNDQSMANKNFVKVYGNPKRESQQRRAYLDTSKKRNDEKKGGNMSIKKKDLDSNTGRKTPKTKQQMHSDTADEYSEEDSDVSDDESETDGGERQAQAMEGEDYAQETGEEETEDDSQDEDVSEPENEVDESAVRKVDRSKDSNKENTF